ncbi:MAG: serine hydrolase [Candidatus Eisenbacteria bacterium]|nr:serine hydrolase [Candidatus Eisenbacteria bacterium]
MVCLVVTAISLVGPAGLVAQNDDVETRIRRVENGLLPAVALEGAPAASFNILERIKLYHVPGLSVAVINDGKVQWARGYGVLESGGEKVVDTQTLFQAASVTKPLVATLALKSVEMGLLDLDAPVNDYLRSWKIPENEFTKETPPTLRHILAHRAGLTVHGFRGYTEGQEIPTVYQILDGLKPANNEAVRVDATPGTQFRYSGGGYVVLQVLLTELHGRPLRELMRQYVFEPAGMDNSAIAYPLDTELRLNAASGHSASGQVIKGKYRVHPEIGAGGLWTTPRDLCRWAIAIQKSYAGAEGTLLSQTTAREMLNPVDGSGLGPVVKVAPEGVVFSHDGSNVGYSCQLIAYADRGQGIAVMVNSDHSTIIGELVRAVAQEYGWPHFRTEVRKPAALSEGMLARFAGKYSLGGMEVEIRMDEGRLIALMPGRGPLRLYATSETEVFNVEDNIVVNFAFDDAGRFLKAGVSKDGQQLGELERVGQ